MKVRVYSCTDQAILSRKDDVIRVASEAFSDVPAKEIEERFVKYPEIAVAQDGAEIAAFVFLTHHAHQRTRLVGLRFIAISNRYRNRGLSTLLTGVVILRKYLEYLRERQLPGGPRELFVMARICNPKAYYTLTKGNKGVSPDLGAKAPLERVTERQSLYTWLGEELGVEGFDPNTAIVTGAAADAGIVPNNTSVESGDQSDWDRYVAPGSEVLMLMPINWRFMWDNALRCVKLFKPVKLRKY